MTTYNNVYGLALNYKSISNNSNPPLFYIKGSAAINLDGENIKFPTDVNKLWTECELGIVIAKKCNDINENQSFDVIKGFVVCGDVTCENIHKRDWHLAFSKSRKNFCPVSRDFRKIEKNQLNYLEIKTFINNEIVQYGNTSDMIYSPLKSVSYISSLIQLQENDLILTGTPSFLKQNEPTLLNVGDKISHQISNLKALEYEIS